VTENIKMKLIENQNAIKTDTKHGPCFGNLDLQIKDRSNIESSRSILGGSYISHNFDTNFTKKFTGSSDSFFITK
jgi:hypothetical protein